MKYQIITIHDKDKWIDYVKRCEQFDFYHSWQYHNMARDGYPLLFLYEEGQTFIIIPFIKRAIDHSTAFDLTSVYGYAGPLSNKSFGLIEESILENFKKAFLNFLENENIKSVFSRLHPIIDNVGLLKMIGGVYANGKTVVIDLTLPQEIQQKKYRKSVMHGIKALALRETAIKEVKNAADLLLFIDIYTENMKRINANPEYYFDREYFESLINTNEFKGQLLLMYLDGDAVAGGAFMHTNGIIEVHLLATKNNYLCLSPTKLLIDEVAKQGRRDGMKYIHIGGGVGGSQDSLFFWKSGFSDHYLDFHTWRYIPDQAAYDQLVQQRFAGRNIKAQGNYFPLYRSPVE